MNADLRKGLSGLAVVVILLLILAYFNIWPFDKGNGVDAKKANTEAVYSESEKVAALTNALNARDAEISRIEGELSSANEVSAVKQAVIDSLIANCGKPAPKKAAVTSSGAPVQRIEIVVKYPNNPGSSGNVSGVPAAKITGNQSEPDYAVGGTKLPRVKGQVEKGECETCWQFGTSAWYPEIALQENNAQFPNLVNNHNKDGHNLAILPSGTIGSVNAPCWITADGIYWIRVSEVQKYEGWVTFDTPLVMINGRFVSTKLVEVNGEQFFIAGGEISMYWPCWHDGPIVSTIAPSNS